MYNEFFCNVIYSKIKEISSNRRHIYLTKLASKQTEEFDVLQVSCDEDNEITH